MPPLALQNAKYSKNSKEKLYQSLVALDMNPSDFEILPLEILTSQTKDNTIFHAQNCFRLPCTTHSITLFLKEYLPY